jgi:hypothetical protein
MLYADDRFGTPAIIELQINAKELTRKNVYSWWFSMKFSALSTAAVSCVFLDLLNQLTALSEMFDCVALFARDYAPRSDLWEAFRYDMVKSSLQR